MRIRKLLKRYSYSSTFSYLILILFLNYTNCSAQEFQDELPEFYENCGTIEEIPGDLRTKIPWVAAIYKRDDINSPFKFLVTGTIIGSHTILSLFGGTMGALPRSTKGRYSLYLPENLLVGLGMKSTKFTDSDKHSQLLPVSYIIPYRGHNSENQHYHFFIIHLKNRINLKTPYAKAICIPPKEYGATVSPYDDWPIDVGGFASPRNSAGAYELKIFSMKTGDYQYCTNTLDFHYRNNGSHVFCAKLRIDDSRFEDINENSCILHGSAQFTGVETSSGPKYFTGGMVSLIPSRKRGLCNSNTTYFIANALIHLDWIFKNIQCGPHKISCSDQKCIHLSQVCNLKRDCSDGWDEDLFFCDAIYSCPKGFIGEEKVLHQCGLNGKCINSTLICNGTPNCSDESDEKNDGCSKKSGQLRSENSEKKSCFLPPITQGMAIECLNSFGIQIPCDAKAPEIGTKILLKCSIHYISKFSYSFVKMTCDSSGSWTPFKPFSCDTDCGTVESLSLESLKNGHLVSQDQIKRKFPWYAGIFKYSDKGKFFKFQCGATLIDKNILVSSAQCFLEFDRNMKISLEKFRIVLSPISSFYVDNLGDTTASVQIFNVWLHPTFNLLSSTPDIILMKLHTSINFNQFVRPVCAILNKYSKLPKTGQFGKISGFGIDDSNDLSKNLQYTVLQVVSYKNCKRSLKNLVSLNSFCVGQKNETSLCRTDKGSGLVFPVKIGSTVKFVLKGIINDGHHKNIRSCAFENFSIFTHVDSYSEWILDILEKIDRN